MAGKLFLSGKELGRWENGATRRYKLYAEVFGPDYPARTCVEVSALPMGLSIEVECIARAK